MLNNFPFYINNYVRFRRLVRLIRRGPPHYQCKESLSTTARERIRQKLSNPE